jgi:uncharacterized membrane protein YdjX (TVP38/TMEM64 family)
MMMESFMTARCGGGEKFLKKQRSGGGVQLLREASAQQKRVMSKQIGIRIGRRSHVEQAERQRGLTVKGRGTGSGGMNVAERRMRRWLLAGLVAGVLMAVGAVWFWARAQGYEPARVFDWVSARVRQMGPEAFFTMMALLPAAGVPVTFFNITAGTVFTPVLGLPAVVALVVTSLGINLALTYAVGRWVLRPWVERLVVWFGFNVPVVRAEEQPAAIVLLRLIPGPPFTVQNYLLGMAGFRFGVYMGVSWPMAVLDAGIYILFGSALAEGSGRLAIVAAGLLVALVLAGRWLRRHTKDGKRLREWQQAETR